MELRDRLTGLIATVIVPVIGGDPLGQTIHIVGLAILLRASVVYVAMVRDEAS